LISAGFHRSFDALAQVFEFTRRFYEAEGVAPEVRLELDFCLEEIYTNLVKYNRGGQQDIKIEIERQGNRLVARITDCDVEPFDLTRVPAPDVTLPLAQREPGGLGLHLVRRLADDLSYDYTNRCSRITVTKRLG
jgi:anti-sigma regulatory factor (Ser/Thr protein kinase)